MVIRKMNHFNLSIIIVSILTIFSCTSGIDNKNSKDLKEITSLGKESVDTTLIQLIDEMITLAPVRDIEKQAFKKIPLDLPLKSGYSYYGSYWIGVGDSNHTKYKSLEQTIPTEWSKPGVSVPLGAYALGKPVVLPRNSSQSVNFMLGTEQEVSKVVDEFNGKIPMQLRISSFQKMVRLPTTEKEKLFLLIYNQDRLNSYNVNIKFIATQIIDN